jgi:hypothetical protein
MRVSSVQIFSFFSWRSLRRDLKRIPVTARRSRSRQPLSRGAGADNHSLEEEQTPLSRGAGADTHSLEEKEQTLTL